MLGVDEHLWRQTRRGEKYVTVIIDLTGIREGTGPARLLDMVSGRSKQAFKQCLAGRDESWREAVEVVAMDALHRVQDRHRRGAGRCGRGGGSVSRRAPRR